MPISNEPGRACSVCRHFACVCTIRKRHAEDCKFRIAAAMAFAIACDHGHDVCAQCDPCSCGAEVAAADLGA